jgi:hypothetical protein
VLQFSLAFAKTFKAKKKAPRETGAHRHRSFSRRATQPLRHRRVAWLTAFQPITVAGPRPIFTAFPAAHAYKLKIECMSRLPACQRVNEPPSSKFSTPYLFNDRSAILPIWFTLFHYRAQPFL